MKPSPATQQRPGRLWLYLGLVATVILAVVVTSTVSWTRRTDGPAPPAATPPTATGDLGRRAQSVIEAYVAAKRAADPPALVVTGQVQVQDGDWELEVGDNNKRADGSGHYVARVPLPEADGEGVVRSAGGQESKTAVVSAREAFEQMTRTRTDCQGCTDLQVTGATLTTMPLSTGEGTFAVPAWRFSLAGTAVTILRSAVPEAAVVTVPGQELQPGVGQVLDSFTVGPDGRSLTLHFTGIPDSKGPCGADYRAEVFESAEAVVVGLVVDPHEAPGSDRVACPAIAQLRTASVVLDTALDGRALLNLAGGQPVPAGATRG